MSWVAGVVVLIVLLLLIYFPLFPASLWADVSGSINLNDLPNSIDLTGSNINPIGPSPVMSGASIRIESYPTLTGMNYDNCKLIGITACRSGGSDAECRETFYKCEFDGGVMLSNFEISDSYVLIKNVWDSDLGRHKDVVCPDETTFSCDGQFNQISCSANAHPCVGYGGDNTQVYVRITFTNKNLGTTTIVSPVTTTPFGETTSTIPVLDEEPKTILDWIIFQIRKLFLRVGVRI